MEKKKIVFMVINMNVGGTERALLNMIYEIPKSQYDITIYMLEKRGGLLTAVPEHVRVKYLEKYREIKMAINGPPLETVKKLFRLGHKKRAFLLLLIFFICKMKKDRTTLYKYLLKDTKVSQTEYDLAIAYAGPMDFISYFILNKIEARKKLQWIHFDISKIGFNRKFASRIYQKFDQVFVVSHQGKDRLLEYCPNLKDKTSVFSNVLPFEEIMNESNHEVGFDDNFQGIRILTVGRLSREKGQDLAIQVLAKLLRNGFDVKWYCIGEGLFREELEDLITKYELQDRFFLLGSSSNPYPYFKKCDIYVQPSRHEGYCLTLAEARVFNKPIVATNFISAKEQLKDGKTGLVVNIHEEEIFDAVKRLIEFPELRVELSHNLSQESIKSQGTMDKLYSFL